MYNGGDNTKKKYITCLWKYFEYVFDLENALFTSFAQNKQLDKFIGLFILKLFEK